MEYTKGLAIIGPSSGSGPYDDGGDYAITTIVKGGEFVIGEAFRRVGEFDIMPAKGNATLWAAAPDLLEACEAALNWVNDFGEHAPIQFGGEAELAESLQAAIAKARGK